MFTDRDKGCCLHSDAALSALFDLPAVQPVLEQPQLPAQIGNGDTGDGSVGGQIGGSADRSSENALKPQSSLPEQVFQQALVQLRKPPNPNTPKAFAFKVVSVNPAQSKVPLQGALETSDVAVSLLKTVRLCVANRTSVVDSTPLRIQPSVCNLSEGPDEGAPAVPLLFSPSCISDEELMKVCFWEIEAETSLHLCSSAANLVENPMPCHRDQLQMPQLLTSLQRAGSDGWSPDTDGSSAEKACFNFLREAGLVEAVPGALGQWALSETAKDHFVVTRTLVHAQSLMRQVPLAEMNLFELYKALEDKGFRCCVCSRSARKNIKKLCYRAGDVDKVWYMEAGRPPSKHYLVSLLHAETHQQAAPALADHTAAQKILLDRGLIERQRQPKAAGRKRLAGLDCAIAEDDWDVPPPPVKRARVKPKAKPAAIAHVDVMPALEDAEGIPPPQSPRSPIESLGSDHDLLEGGEPRGSRDCPDAADEAGAAPACDVAGSGSPSESSSSSVSSASTCERRSRRAESSLSSSSSPSSGKPKRKQPKFARKKDMSRSTVAQN